MHGRRRGSVCRLERREGRPSFLTSSSALGGEDSEVGAIHPAQVTPTALLRMHDMRRMVALGIESRRKREHVGRTKLHTETAGFTVLDDDGNTPFCH